MIRGRRGFTLLEAMVALVILGLAVGAYLELFGTTVHASSNADEWARVVWHAEQGMELAVVDVRMVPSTTEQLPDGFTRTTTIQPWTGSTSLLTVTVGFPDGRAFALRRLVASGP